MHYHKGLGQKAGLSEAQIHDLDKFEQSSAYNDLEKLVLRFDNSEGPPSNGHCCGVADENTVLAGEKGDVTQKCTQCGKDGAELEAYYGEASAWLHRGACEGTWRAACDADDLTIPSYLDRRSRS